MTLKVICNLLVRISTPTGRSIKSLFTYKFKQDVNTLLDDYQIPYDQAFEKLFVVECGHPPIIKHYLGGSISLETLVVFEKCLGFVSNFDKKLSDPIWKEVRTRH